MSVDDETPPRRGLRRPQASPAGSERLSRRPSSASVDAMQVTAEHLKRTVGAAIDAAMGRGHDLGAESMRAEMEAARRAVARADAAQLEYQRDLRQVRDDLDAAREEIQLRGERLQELRQVLDDTTAELYRARALARPQSVTQLQVPAEQEQLRKRARAKSEADFRRLSSRPPEED